MSHDISTFENSFAGQTFGADDQTLNNISFSASKHPRISKHSPFYRISKPQTDQKCRTRGESPAVKVSQLNTPKLRLSSPNKENRCRPVIIQRLATSPQKANYKEACLDVMGLFRQQRRLYELLLEQPQNSRILTQLQQLHAKFDCYTKLF